MLQKRATLNRLLHYSGLNHLQKKFNHTYFTGATIYTSEKTSGVSPKPILKKTIP